MKVKFFYGKTAYAIELVINDWFADQPQEMELVEVKQSDGPAGIVVSVWYLPVQDYLRLGEGLI